uniref:RNA-binding protein NOB1 n=1 Tax=Aegilops tauschii subsp. strangulata TaxID=200361 RepID=A0A453MV70_AEGTS
EEAWPALGPAAGDAAFPPPPPPGAPAGGGAPVAWGAAATARREAVAKESPAQAVSRIVSSCANSSGLAVAVVDANAVISGGAALASTAGRLVTVPEVLEEVRDAAARRRLALLPTPVETVEPAPEFVKRVVKFARETGDLQTLSDVDMKIIALAYMLEAEVHGTSHLREHPPPLHVVSVRTLQEAPLPGWGSNVPNLEEWEALDKMSEAGGNLNSRILPLKDLENQEIPTSETNSISETQGGEEFQPSKKDACIPWEDDENNEGWLPAVGRTTHRKYLRRKARRDALKASGESFDTSSVAPSVDEDNDLSENGLDSVDGPSAVPEKTRSNTDNLESLEGNEPKIAGDQLSNGENGVGDADTVEGIIDTDSCTEQLDNLDIKSETEEGVSASFVDDESSEQSWALRWVLRCHACYKVTQEIGKIFCPKCGNGGTLRKVSVTVGENGITMASRRPRVTLRGTKFSLPMPQGGRDAVIKNPILREDQLPQKVLHPKSKKSSKLGDDFLGAEDIFTHSGEKKVELKPPVRKALAMFSGKRNPNDNHFSRKKN